MPQEDTFKLQPCFFFAKCANTCEAMIMSCIKCNSGLLLGYLLNI